ncbi:MAG: helix-turn-helix domain-containing protein [Clostridia bacterium]|nr:helix-turn-helix domain-containing protein [Clostridia bacterium]
MWEKKWLTLEEAAAYSGIGRNKIRELSQQKNCPFAIWLGGKLYIIREKMDDFTDKQFKI